jgi:hypothetical protein
MRMTSCWDDGKASTGSFAAAVGEQEQQELVGLEVIIFLEKRILSIRDPVVGTGSRAFIS